jgi:hypothetical protein
MLALVLLGSVCTAMPASMHRSAKAQARFPRGSGIPHVHETDGVSPPKVPEKSFFQADLSDIFAREKPTRKGDEKSDLSHATTTASLLRGTREGFHQNARVQGKSKQQPTASGHTRDEVAALLPALLGDMHKSTALRRKKSGPRAAQVTRQITDERNRPIGAMGKQETIDVRRDGARRAYDATEMEEAHHEQAKLALHVDSNSEKRHDDINTHAQAYTQGTSQEATKYSGKDSGIVPLKAVDPTTKSHDAHGTVGTNRVPESRSGGDDRVPESRGGSSEGVDRRIIGGVAAEKGEYPWIVRIEKVGGEALTV